MTTANPARATVTVISETEIEIKRTFNAPARLVYEAWLKPEHMRRWYGPRAMEMVDCEIDARVGGRYQWSLKSPDGSVFFWRGEYRELDFPTRMVTTESFLLGDTWTTPLVNHVSFVEEGGRTHITNRVVYASQADRDGHLGSGMEGGMNETFERLDAFLATQS